MKLLVIRFYTASVIFFFFELIYPTKMQNSLIILVIQWLRYKNMQKFPHSRTLVSVQYRRYKLVKYSVSNQIKTR
jgi:hypothetical protein